jgi:hypothetical protein
MIRGSYILALAAVLAQPGLASAGLASGEAPTRQKQTPAAVSEPSARPAIVLVARGRSGGAHGVRAAPRVGSAGRFPHPAVGAFPFRRFPFRPFPFRPFVGFGFVAALYEPYYWYNPYCDPVSVYYYPPWCSY